MSSLPKWLKYSALSLLTIGVGFTIGYFVNGAVNKLTPEETKFLEEYRLLKDEWLFGNESEYLDDLIAAGIISSPANNLDDPYTIYTSTYEEQGLSTDHLGLGFTSHSYDGGLYVCEVHFGPNENKLQVGDVIYGCYKNNDPYYDFTKYSNAEISAYLSENVNSSTTYKMNILRGETYQEINLIRGEYTERSVNILKEPNLENGNTLAIKISSFLGDPTSEVKKILNNYTDIKITNLVIDLRQNTGGLVSQAEALSKLFVKKGTLIYQFRDKNNEVTKEVFQNEDPLYTIPHYNLIIDDNTASASETFALAMRAGSNCQVYGLKSFGKGIAQEFKTFSDGSVVKYTSSYVYGPEKENENMYDEGKDNDSVMCIHGKGIIPDISYDLEYTYLQKIYDYTDNYFISNNEGSFFIDMLNDVYPDKNFPDEYSIAFSFEDAINAFTGLINEKYETDYKGFTDDGIVSKEINDKIIKESYDAYLLHYDHLTNLAMENI